MMLTTKTEVESASRLAVERAMERERERDCVDGIRSQVGQVDRLESLM